MNYCSGDDFRAAMGRWCTGVAVVTVAEDGEFHGMTVSSFTSVSVTPPTILICLTSKSRTAECIRSSGAFAVSILSAGQQEISNRFAGRDGADDRFDGVDHVVGESGLPLIERALVSLECAIVQTHDAGDHQIFMGGVSVVHPPSETDPLLYFDRGYREIVYGRRRDPR